MLYIVVSVRSQVGQCFRSNSSMKVLRRGSASHLILFTYSSVMEDLPPWHRTSVPMLPETKVRLKPKSNQSARKLAVPTFLYIVSINVPMQEESRKIYCPRVWCNF